MQEILDIQPAINVLDSEYVRLLGYPASHQLDKRAQELMQISRDWYAQNGQPWIYARPSERFELLENAFKIDGIEFHSKYLLNQFKKSMTDRVMLVAVSAGPQCEEQARRLWLEHKPDEYFFMEMYGSAVVEHLIASTGARFCAWADQHEMAVLPHYSPGYSGWDIKAQNTLLSLLEQSVTATFPEEMTVMETGMLTPKKSLLAVFGLTQDVSLTKTFDKLIPCENCALPNCAYRRADFKFSLRLMEDVSKLQPQTFENTTMEEEILDRNAIYHTSRKALEKWSQQRLKIIEHTDGTTEARFRYEGSTCSNMGFPLAYDYRIVLDSAERNYIILDMSCTPAPGNEGYTKMCGYIKNPQKLTSAIEEEKPLLSQPLNDVLKWERTNRPSGCYCDKSSRQHKWSLVMEVVHFAMAHRTVSDEKLVLINE